MKIFKNKANQFQGSSPIIITEFEEGAKLSSRGSGLVAIQCPLPNNVTISKTGSGNLSILNSVGSNVTISQVGSGDCRIQASVGSGLSLSSVGSGKIIIEGDVGKSPRFNIRGSGVLHFKNTVGDDLEFDGLESAVFFEKRPSEMILDTIKKAQEKTFKDALTSNDGFNEISCGSHQIKYKSFNGFFMIEENGNRNIYKGSKLQIKNETLFIDGMIIKGFEQEKNSSLISKIDKFSKSHPILFLVVTLGIGIFWNLARSVQQNTTTTITANQYGSNEQDDRFYYLADTQSIIQELQNSKSSSASILRSMPPISRSQDGALPNSSSKEVTIINKGGKQTVKGIDNKKDITIINSGGVQTVSNIGNSNTTVFCSIQ